MVSSAIVLLLSLFGFTGVFSNIADYDCFERFDAGFGRAYFPSYAWSARSQTCTPFVYGGVLGNRNRFQTEEECKQNCHDAVLRRQLNFSRSRRYSLVNRLSPTTQIPCNLEVIDDGYFSIILSQNTKVLGVRLENGTANVDVQVTSGNELQQWDIIPTGEADYYRIKTASRRTGGMDFLFLQVPLNDTVNLDLARRDSSYFGQQWRIL